MKIFTDHKNITCKTLIPIAYYGGDSYYMNVDRRLIISQAITLNVSPLIRSLGNNIVLATNEIIETHISENVITMIPRG